LSVNKKTKRDMRFHVSLKIHGKKEGQVCPPALSVFTIME